MLQCRLGQHGDCIHFYIHRHPSTICIDFSLQCFPTCCFDMMKLEISKVILSKILLLFKTENDQIHVIATEIWVKGKI